MSNTKKTTTKKKQPTKKEKPMPTKVKRPLLRKGIERQKKTWQVNYWLSKDILRHQPGWKMAGFGILKVTDYPKEGETLQRKHYKGFLIRFRFWLPFEWGH